MTGILVRYTIHTSLDLRRNVRYFFSIQHFWGKFYKGADTISCNPVVTVEALINLYPTHPSSKDVHLSDNIDTATELATIQVTINTMTPDHIQAWSQNEQS